MICKSVLERKFCARDGHEKAGYSAQRSYENGKRERCRRFGKVSISPEDERQRRDPLGDLDAKPVVQALVDAERYRRAAAGIT